MSSLSFTAEHSLPANIPLTQSYERARRQHGGAVGDPDVLMLQSDTGRCPLGCHEANVACTGFFSWDSCWCPSGGKSCPAGGWWLSGACVGYWQLGCQ